MCVYLSTHTGHVCECACACACVRFEGGGGERGAGEVSTNV